MQAIKQQRVGTKWYIFGFTTSLSSTMAFDRLRLSNNSGVEVGIMSPSNSANYTGSFANDSIGDYLIDNNSLIEQVQPFHAGGGWTTTPDEHDFSFDCSGFSYGNGNDDGAVIVMKGIDLSNKFWQLYAFPTGFGGTRNKNAELLGIDYATMRIGTVGAQIGRLRLTSQGNVIPYETFVNSGQLSPVNAKEVRLEGTSKSTVSQMLGALVLGGETGGTLSYNTADRPDGFTNAQSDYDTLISRSWSITGGRPSL